jgi:hypothetical protein
MHQGQAALGSSLVCVWPQSVMRGRYQIFHTRGKISADQELYPLPPKPGHEHSCIYFTREHSTLHSTAYKRVAHCTAWCTAKISVLHSVTP